jgi:uncharacterized protein (TIGR03437 family)
MSDRFNNASIIAASFLLTVTAALAQPPTNSLAVVNAASGGTPAAPGSIAAAFGRQIGASTVAASSLPLSTVLGGMSVEVVDSGHTARLASLFYVSPNQINFVVPDATKIGTATVNVKNATSVTSTSTVNIAAVAPGLFTANGAGVGVAAAIAIRHLIASQTDSEVPVFHCDNNGCSSIGIEMGPDATVFLELFGTGIRGRSGLANVAATIGGESVNVLFAGPQGQFPGLDQVNLSLPQSMHTRGETDIVLTVDGVTANKVRINLKDKGN